MTAPVISSPSGRMVNPVPAIYAGMKSTAEQSKK